jgi:hypothetical protein
MHQPGVVLTTQKRSSQPQEPVAKGLLIAMLDSCSTPDDASAYQFLAKNRGASVAGAN